MISFSLDVGVRFRGERLFLDLAAGPVAQQVLATPWKPWRGDYTSGWTAAASGSDFKASGAWPLPIDVSVAAGVAL
jgi:hypothetical protein